MSKKTVFVSGKVYWAKIVGDKALVDNYEKTGREWVFDFEPDDTEFLREARLLDRLKEPRGKDAAERGDYLVLKKPELNKEGEKNEPFRIYDENDEPWDDRLLGNGTQVDVKLAIHDWGVGKKKSIYTTAIRVTDLVPYASSEFGAMKKDVTPKAQTKVKAKAKPLAELDDDLDDEVPPFDAD